MTTDPMLKRLMCWRDFQEDTVVWVNPYHEDQVYTVGDLFEYEELINIVKEYLATYSDGKTPDLDQFYEDCESLGITPYSCPMCGLHRSHTHAMN